MCETFSRDTVNSRAGSVLLISVPQLRALSASAPAPYACFQGLHSTMRADTALEHFYSFISPREAKFYSSLSVK